ncbi:hypothetical protein GPECTOR_17g855 [Gonium pectorale]|uniref:thiamine phosphate synthase n=1 Tax=Gonium pectorale TaxID=33097 RepID=A0A150GK88_GONPE|nr:hypothetical protein GPECTOR_17g855 [Gonium pectorale]|eukprot:KXZ50218.1 hypothetical protein GPECTOR_17g855 [Gonium pectorale]
MAAANGVPDGLPATAGLSRELWESSQHEVFMSLHDPFVQGMAQGTLDRRAFQHYVAQDAHFLKYFARAYGIALSKALALDDATFATLSRLLRGVHEELRLHVSYAARWGVELGLEEEGEAVGSGSGSGGSGGRGVASSATRAYTDFLMSVAEAHGEDGGVAEILAAMLPCSRLYGYLGSALAAAHGAGGAGSGLGPSPANEFWEWVQTYSSPDYLAIPALKEAMFDRLAAHSDKGRLQSLYRRAMQLEAEFFAAQPHSPPPRRIAALVVDFDETCTPRDTIGGLMGLAAAAARAGRPTGGDASWAEATPGRLADNYVAAQGQLLAELLPEGAAPSPEYDPAGLSSFLERLSDFDERMNAVVEESGILKGSTEQELAAAGAALPLRPHCRETLSGALRRGIPVRVLSVNWSDVYVGAALGLPTQLARADEAPAMGAGAAAGGAVGLSCNSLQLDSAGLTSGRLTKRVQSARDKRNALAALREALAAAATAGGGGGGAVVYVGDSVSDLAALLAADVGVVVGTNRLLRRVAERFGVRLRPLAAAPLAATAAEPPSTSSAAGGKGVLYEAAGWEEIRAFLFGVERCSGEEAGRRAGGGGAAERTAPGLVAEASLPRVLSIAGSDSGGGAGIQADLKAMLSRGVFGMTALTALTAQNTHGVHAVHAVPPEFLAAQIDAVLSDLGADAVKTGMLPNAEAVETVAERVRHYRAAAAAAAAAAVAAVAANGDGDGAASDPSPAGPLPPSPLPLVVDPVLVSTSGHSLAEGGVAAALLRSLLPLATLATPNIPEAEALLGCGPIRSVEDMRRAAQELQVRTGCGAVLVKGGHLRPSSSSAADADAAEVVDVLYDGHQLHELRGAWVHTGNTHGTGCTLASAIAAELAKGLPLLSAVAAAREALQRALRESAPLALGSGVQRPFHHLHMLPPHAQPQPQPQPGSAWGGWGLRRADPAAVRRAMRLYAVTDPHCNQKTGRSLVEAVTLAVRGGATIVQLREKDIDGGDFARQAAEALKVCRQHGVPLLINDRVDVALAVGADGVHVGQSDLPAATVRAMIGPSRILGVSVKTPAEARAAAAAGADYLGAGAVLPTGTKDTNVIGLEGLEAVCSAAAPLPVVAIGGVSAANAGDTVRAGCAGIAVVSAIFAAEDAEGAARKLRTVVDEALGRASRVCS